jgi:hypothetical protein
MNKMFGCVAALSLAACISTTPRGPVYVHFARSDNETIAISKRVCIDPKFDQEDQIDILSAIQEWNDALNGKALLITSDFVCDWHIVMQVGDTLNVPKIDYEPGTKYEDVGAYAQIGGNLITVIRPHLHSQYHLQRAIVHEIGHLLGAKHAVIGIMKLRLSYRSYQCIDYNALSQVAKYNNFSCARCNYCIQE